MRAKRTLIMRTCRDCGHEQTILGEEIDEALLLLLDTLEEELGDSAFTILSHRIKTGDLTSVLCHLKRQLRSPIPTPKLVYFLRKLLQDSRGDDVGLFANKQLAVLGMCSGTFCDFCTMRICLRCGQSDWHEGDTCLEFAQKRLETLSLNDPEYSSLNWMVKYGKSCPKCFLLISKEEDGSCNQIKCTFCGFSFCWECLREWSSACGYYRCSLTQKSDETSDLIKSSSQKNRKPAGERTEAGIPDVTKLPSFSPS